MKCHNNLKSIDISNVLTFIQNITRENIYFIEEIIITLQRLVVKVRFFIYY